MNVEDIVVKLKNFLQSAANPVLISVHPVFATEIVEGRKCVEFRRRWTQRQTDIAVIYSTAPVQKIVAVVEIKEVVRAECMESENRPCVKK